MRNLLIVLLVIFLVFIASAFCSSLGAPQETTQISTIPVQTPFPTVGSLTITEPTLPPTAPPAAAPLNTQQLPVENSEWYIDGWAEDGVVVNIHGREIRFDLAEFRNTQTNAAVIVQCIDPQAGTPNLDFTLPVQQRDHFIYKGNQFWHVSDPTIQRFIFLRHGELQ